MTEFSYTYRAFISYSHADHKWAVWLHRALERYRVPRRLLGSDGRRRLGKVFRDEEELAAAAELGPKIDAALKSSDVLIVICSPRAARSKWVNQEVEAFKRLGREHRVFALIVDGQPHDPEQECLPNALKQTAAGGVAEPLAVDIRKFGREDASLRLIAGMLDLGYDDLRQRELRRRRAERRGAQALFATGLLLTAGAVAGGWFTYINFMSAADRTAALFARETHALADEGSHAKAILLALYGDPAARAGPVEHLSRPDGYPAVRVALDHAYAGNHLLQAFQGPESYRGLEAASVDGRIVYARGLGAILQGWETEDDRLLASIPLQPLEPFALSSDGQTVLTGHANGVVSLWRAADGASIRSFQALEESLAFVGFSPDGSLLVTTGSQGGVKLWHADTGTIAATFAGHTALVDAAELSADNRRLLTSSFDGQSKLWDAAGGLPMATYPAQDFVAPSWAFSANGSVVAIGTGVNTVTLVNAEDAQVLQTYPGAGALVSVVFSRDGSFLLAAFTGGVAKLWRRDGSEAQTFNTASLLETADLSPDNRYVTTGGRDGLVRIWQTNTGRIINVLAGHDGPVSSVRFSADGSRVLSGAWDGSANLWQLNTDVPASVFASDEKGILALDYSPDGKLVVTGGNDQIVRVWNTGGSGSPIVLKGHTGPIKAVAFSKDGETVLSGSHDGKAKLWRIKTGEVTTFSGHSGVVTSVAYSPDGSNVLTSSNDGTAKLWPIAGGPAIQTYVDADGPLYGAAFAPDGKSVVTGAQGGTARLWPVGGGVAHLTMKGHTNNITTVAFSPDGTMIATGSRDNTTKLWSAVTGEMLANLSGFEGEISSVEFSPDNRYVLTSALDGAARLWSVVGGEAVQTFKAPSSLFAAVFSPDGQSVLTAPNGDGAALWRLNSIIRETPDGHVKIACERLARIGVKAFSEVDYGRLPLLDRKAPHPCAKLWTAVGK